MDLSYSRHALYLRLWIDLISGSKVCGNNSKFHQEIKDFNFDS